MIEPGARHTVEELMERLRPFVARRLGSAADVDDVLQEVFLRMQQGVHRLRDADRLGPWLYRVVRSVIADQHRARAREAGPPVGEEIADGADTAPARSGPPEAHGAAEPPEPRDELVRCVAPFVAQLPSPYREAVTLVDLEGASGSEAAAMLGVSLTALKSRVQRGRAQLRALFEDCCRLEFDVRRRLVDYECGPGASVKCGCRSE